MTHAILLAKWIRIHHVVKNCWPSIPTAFLTAARWYSIGSSFITSN